MIGLLLIVLLVGNNQLLTEQVNAQQLNQSIPPPNRLASVVIYNGPISEPKSENKGVGYIEPYSEYGGAYCNCKRFLEVSGIDLPKTVNGQARTLPLTHSEPFIGAVVITNESAWGHLAHVDDIVDNYLILNEANYVRCRQTKGRKLHVTSLLIIGYYKNMNEMKGGDNNERNKKVTDSGGNKDNG